MDKTMTEREAFEAWLMKRYQGHIGDKDYRSAVYEMWQAACKFQRDRDAEICTPNLIDRPTVFETAAIKKCAAAILNQGSKE